MLKTIVVKGFPMGIQMIVISLSALALVGLVNSDGVDTTAAFGVAMQLWTYVQMPAMALGAAVSAMAAQNIGAGHWDRVGRMTRSGMIQTLVITAVLVVLLTLSDRAVLALFMGPDSPALPIARHIHVVATWNFMLFGVTMVLFGDGARKRRGVGAADHPVHRPVAGPLRLHFRHRPAGSARTRSGGASRSARSSTSRSRPAYYLERRLEESADDGFAARPDDEECTEEALATREPGGALNPAG